MNTTTPCIVVLYRGATVASARVMGATSDPDVVTIVSQALLGPRLEPDDPAFSALQDGRARAIERCRREAEKASQERGEP